MSKNSADDTQPKIGSGHMHAMARLGLRELRNAVSPSKESVADQEIGLYGTLTQGEVADLRHDGPSPGKEWERDRYPQTPNIDLSR